MTGIELDAVSVSLGGRNVVSGIDARFDAGHLVAILGPNGAGKTTLLRAIAGLLPYAGRIQIGGVDARSMTTKERARTVGYLPQGHVAYWPLPARDIVGLGLYASGARDPLRLTNEQRKSVDEAMAMTGAAAFAERPVTELSGGERARVALARVVVARAPVILADEPTAALDPRYQLDIMALLRRQADAGALVIAVTHDLTLASRYANTVMMLQEGRCVASGPPESAMTPDRIGSVFEIDICDVEHFGERVIVPWRAR